MSAHTRPLRVADLPLIALAGRAPYANHAVTLEHGAASAGARPGWPRLLRNSVQPGGREVWISREGLSLRGLAAVRPRGGASAWEIDALVLGLTSEAFVMDLLERCVATAGARGAHRLFLRLAEGSPILTAARREGFAAAGVETLLVRGAGREGEGNAAPPAATAWRRRGRADDHDLFRFFGDSVSHDVRWQIALTPREWRAAQEPLGRGGREWGLDRRRRTRAAARRPGRRGRARDAAVRRPPRARGGRRRIVAPARSRGRPARTPVELLLPGHLTRVGRGLPRARLPRRRPLRVERAPHRAAHAASTVGRKVAGRDGLARHPIAPGNRNLHHA